MTKQSGKAARSRRRTGRAKGGSPDVSAIDAQISRLLTNQGGFLKQVGTKFDAFKRAMQRKNVEASQAALAALETVIAGGTSDMPALAEFSRLLRVRSRLLEAEVRRPPVTAPPGRAPKGTRRREAKPSEFDLARRRAHFLDLRYRQRLAHDVIADRLGVSITTVERDQAWWKQRWREQYGTENPAFDPIEKIGETLDFYTHLEQEALAELRRLGGDHLGDAVALLRTTLEAPSAHETETDRQAREAERTRALGLLEKALTVEDQHGRFVTYRRMRVLKVLEELRDRQIGFLQDLGLLDRNLGTLEVPGLGRALTGAQLRAELEQLRRVGDDELLSDAERQQRKGTVH